MKRHSVNVFSLAFGLILILLAATTAFPARGWLFGVPQWLLPAAVIVVGVALMSPLLTYKKAKPEGSEQRADGVWNGGNTETHAGGSATPDVSAESAEEEDGAPSGRGTREARGGGSPPE